MSTDETVHATTPVDDGADEHPPADRSAAQTRRSGGSRRRPRRGAPTDAAASQEQVDGDHGRPRRRDHPVFTPLAGFFTGVLLVLVVGGLLGAVLDLVLGYDVGDHPWVLLAAPGAVLVATLALLAVRSTRRFARYMLFGVLTTPAVIAAVAALTFWLLLRGDG